MTHLKIDNVDFSTPTKSILNNISFELPAGKMLGLVGPNGAGKSTLLKVIANLITPTAGTCQIDGKYVSELTAFERATQLGYLAQGAETHWPLKVKRVIELGRLPYQKGRSKLDKVDQEAIAKAIKQTEVSHLLDRIITTLSGGERLRVLLARLFATNPAIILADEPIASLDPYHQLHIMEILREHANNGGIVITVLHDLNHAARFCDELLLISDGKKVDWGEPRKVLKKENVENVYSITVRQDVNDDQFTIFPQERIPHE